MRRAYKLPNWYWLIIVLISSLLPACNTAPSAAYKHTEADSLKKYLAQRIKYLFINYRYDEAKSVLERLQPAILKNGDPRLKHQYLLKWAQYFINTKQTDSARHYCDSALELARHTGNAPGLVIEAKRMISSCFRTSGHLDSALFYAKDVYDDAIKQKDTTALSEALVSLYEVYGTIGDNELYGKYLLEAYALTKDSDKRAVLYSNILGYYMNADQPDSADFFYRTRILADTTVSSKVYEYIQLNYGYLLLSVGKVDEAIALFKKAREVHIKNGTPMGMLYYDMSLAYRKKGRYTEAQRYLDTVLAIARKTGDEELHASGIYDMACCAFSLGNYRKAADLYDSAYFLYQKYHDAAFGRQNRELEIKYDVKLRDAEIKRLAAISAAAKKQAALQRYLLLSLAIAALLGLVTFYQYNRRRKLTTAKEKAEADNEKIQLEQRLLRTQMEPHFIFNTLAQLQSQIRNHENAKAERYLSQFAGLLRSSLENSRESFVQLGEEVAALQYYLSLQALRLEDAFEYELHLYEGYESDPIAIPPMLLQPFVENALQHGLKSLGRKGRIDIRIHKNDSMLFCTIEDNGIGVSVTEPVQGQKGSLSTKITRERLALLKKTTNKPASLTIYNKKTPHTGTVVEIVVPYTGLD